MVGQCLTSPMDLRLTDRRGTGFTGLGYTQRSLLTRVVADRRLGERILGRTPALPMSEDRTLSASLSSVIL